MNDLPPGLPVLCGRCGATTGDPHRFPHLPAPLCPGCAEVEAFRRLGAPLDPASGPHADSLQLQALLARCGVPLLPVGEVAVTLGALKDFLEDVPAPFADWGCEVVHVAAAARPSLWLGEFRSAVAGERRSTRLADPRVRHPLAVETRRRSVRLRSFLPGRPGFVEIVPGTRPPGDAGEDPAPWVIDVRHAVTATDEHRQHLDRLARWFGVTRRPSGHPGRWGKGTVGKARRDQAIQIRNKLGKYSMKELAQQYQLDVKTIHRRLGWLDEEDKARSRATPDE